MRIRERQQRLLRLLRAGTPTGPVMARLLGVSVRTVYRDVASLRDQGFAIVARIGRRGGHWLGAKGTAEGRLTFTQIRTLVGAILAASQRGALLGRRRPEPLVEMLLHALPAGRERTVRALFAGIQAPERLRGPLARHIDELERAIGDEAAVDLSSCHRYKTHLTRALPRPLQLTADGWVLPLVAYAIRWPPLTEAWLVDLRKSDLRPIPPQPLPTPLQILRIRRVRHVRFEAQQRR